MPQPLIGIRRRSPGTKYHLVSAFLSIALGGRWEYAWPMDAAIRDRLASGKRS